MNYEFVLLCLCKHQVTVHQHRHKQHAVQPVQHAAVAGEQVGEILDPAVPFHQAGEQVADLAGNPAQEAQDQVMPPHRQLGQRRGVAERMAQAVHDHRGHHATGEPADAYRIDANTRITVLEKGRQRSSDTLSAGYRDLLGVCMRLAMADAMYTGEKPTLIMDDPFVNLDDRKIKGAERLLKEAGEDYQIIYLTCRDERRL